MDRIHYSSTAAMIVAAKSLSSIANNVANYDTNGYKRDVNLSTDFSKTLIEKIDDNRLIGSLKNQVALDATVTIMEQGTLKETKSDKDFAIKGTGFFKVMKDNNYFYTRDGGFSIDKDNYLVAKNGAYVLDKNNQRIIFNENEDYTKRLNIVDFQDNMIGKTGENQYTALDGAVESPSNSEIVSGFVESSNTKLEDEMTEMIKYQRYFQINQRAMKANDELLEKRCNF